MNGMTRVACGTSLHRHELRCDGCGAPTTEVVVTTTRRYPLCFGCHERGRRGWYRPDRQASA